MEASPPPSLRPRGLPAAHSGDGEVGRARGGVGWGAGRVTAPVAPLGTTRGPHSEFFKGECPQAFTYVHDSPSLTPNAEISTFGYSISLSHRSSTSH